MSVLLLDLVRPFTPILPDVKSPGRNIQFEERIVWTFIALLIYLIASQVPLFGIMNSDSADPLYWMRMMMASNRGTLMDLGISPILTSGMILQGLVNLEFLQVNYNVKEDQVLYDTAQKLLALIMTFGQAIGQVMTGFYGDPKGLGPTTCFLLIAQLMFSGIIIILLDELLTKGYGMGNGVNLFIATNVCENIVWKCFSPKVFNTARGVEFEGALVSFVHLLIVRKNKLHAIYEAFSRSNLPNMSTILATIIGFLVVIYFFNIRVDLPVESTVSKGQSGKWPIKLFYSSTTPIIAQSYIISHISTISRFLFNRLPTNAFVRALGIWEMNHKRRYVPVGGICYFIYPPENFSEIFTKPIASLIYISIMIMSSALLSKAWIEMNNTNSKGVAAKMKEKNLTVKGVRDNNLPEYLNNYVPVAAFLGGLTIGFICVFCNILDTLGSGTNIILTVSIVSKYFEEFSRENLKKGSLVIYN